MSIETFLNNVKVKPTLYIETILDDIVMDGEKGSPCFLGNPSDAPWGANLCDTNVSVCLEKWAGPNAGLIAIARKSFSLYHCQE